MDALWLLTKKNLKLLLRSRTSALIIIFAPLLMILLLGLSFNTSDQFGITVGVYAPAFGDDAHSFIALLEGEGFSVTQYDSSIGGCVQEIKQGSVHACIALPESLQVEDNLQKEITFYIDPSRINLVWMIQEVVGSKFNLKSQEISQALTSNILSNLASTKEVLGNEQASLSTIKDKTNTAANSAQATKDSLAAVDTATSANSYNASVVDTVSGDIRDSKNKIDDAISSVNSAGLDDEKEEEIKTYLADARSTLNGLLVSFNSSDTSTVGGLITALQADLADAQTKLSVASSAIGNANADLDTTASSLREATASLETVQASLNSAHEALAAQKITAAETIISPLISKIETVSPEGTYLNYLFPSLLVLVVMFSSLLLGTTLVMIEKNSPAFLRNFFLPVRKIVFVTSTYITTLIVVAIEIIIILALSLLFLEDTLMQLPLVALILVLAGSVFIFLGMVVGYLFISEETGVLASISLGSVLLFLSGVIFPIEGVSKLLRGITSFNPFVIAEKLVREVFIFRSSFVDIAADLGLILAYAVILFLIILLVESVLHEHIVHRFLKHHHYKHRQNEKRNKGEI